MKDVNAQELPQQIGHGGRVAEAIFGIYAWATLLVGISVAILFALVIPGFDRRRRSISGAARSWLCVTGIRSRLTGGSNIPAGHCIVVANHSSYLDGLILQAFLPPCFAFVIKGEMQEVPLAHFLLRRIGSKFVDRSVASASSRGALSLLRAAAGGESLAMFPEGTIHPEAGLHGFRLGAFAAAIKADLPIVPVVIRGSRHILPAHRIMPRHGHLRIDILAALRPGDAAFQNSRLLAEAARQRILTVLDEPDLAVRRANDESAE